MKKNILLLLLLIVFEFSFGQQKQSAPQLTKTDYLQKSKRQNTIALVTGISGTLLCTIGGIMYLSEFEDGLSGGTGYNETNAKNGNALMIAGGGLLLISFPFRVAARKNKRLAIAIKNDPLHALQKNGFRINHVPSLAFKINL